MAILADNLRDASRAADAQRAVWLAKALSYYDGDGPGQILTVKRGGPDDNVAVNYASTIVDKGAAFLFGCEADIEIGPQDDFAGEDYLDSIWQEDERAVDLLDLATNGGIFGHAWAKIVLNEGIPQVVILDPLNMSAQWDPKNYKRVLRYRNQYNTTDASGQPIIWREDTERNGAQWVIREYSSRPDAAGWTLEATTDWPWPFAPVFECKNLPKANEFYGRADLSRFVLSLCFYLARVDSLINRIIRAHAGPKPIAKGIAEQDLKVGIDETLFLPSPEQDLKLLEMSGDLNGALAFRKQLREALAEVSHVPEIASGKLDGVGTLSGLALKILYGPLVDQTERKRRLYGKLLKDLVRALLVIGQTAAEQPIEINWPTIIPGDEKEAADVALVKHQLGVSADTLLREMGYDAEAEAEKYAAEQDQAMARAESAFNRGGNGTQ